MTIRNRTERATSGTRATRLAGVAAAAGLAGAGVLHALWASGSTWPAADAADLADLVIGRVPVEAEGGGAPVAGRRPMPGTVATIGVAGLLGTAAVLTAGASGVIPWPGRALGVARLGTRVASGVLLARGSVGLAVSSLGMGSTTERFRRWNRRVYSPLCLGLGAAAALATGGGRR